MTYVHEQGETILISLRTVTERIPITNPSPKLHIHITQKIGSSRSKKYKNSWPYSTSRGEAPRNPREVSGGLWAQAYRPLPSATTTDLLENSLLVELPKFWVRLQFESGHKRFKVTNNSPPWLAFSQTTRNQEYLPTIHASKGLMLSEHSPSPSYAWTSLQAMALLTYLLDYQLWLSSLLKTHSVLWHLKWNST